MKPIRIQRKRIKGWEKPPNTVYVGRGTKWGNPFKLINNKWYLTWGISEFGIGGEPTIEDVLRWYEKLFKNGKVRLTEITNVQYYFNEYHKRFKFLDLSELKGKNLMCWCKLDSPCHADILLKLANKEI